jgi:hypothetical protein
MIGEMPPMNTRTKNTAWTLALVLFLAFASYGRLQWLSLIIPGAVLTWYGLVAAGTRARNAGAKKGPEWPTLSA